VAKSNHFVNEESTRHDESPAHKNRRKEQQRLVALTYADDFMDEAEDEEFDTFERIPKKPKKVGARKSF
jgi:hypothetical protein